MSRLKKLNSLLPMRRGFSWSFAGNATYTLSQWLLFVILARIAGPEEVGLFALMLAVAAPVFLVAGMNLRVLIVTDLDDTWSMREYLLLRHILNGLASVVLVLLGLAWGLRGFEFAALVALAGAKSIEGLSHAWYGLFQRYDRLDLIARSLILRGTLGPAGFLAGFQVGGSLLGAILGLGIAWTLVQALADRRGAQQIERRVGAPVKAAAPPDWRAIRRLARVGVLTGLDAGVSSLAINSPRLVIDVTLGAAKLGLYAPLAYLAQAVQMITSSLAVPALTRLNRMFIAGNAAGFVKLLAGVSVFGAAVGALSAGLAYAWGDAFIRLTLGPEFVDRELLVLLMLGAGVVSVQRALCKGLEATRSFGAYLAVDALTTVCVVGLSVVLVERLGLRGAPLALMAGFAAGTLGVLCILLVMIRRPGGSLKAPDSSATSRGGGS